MQPTRPRRHRLATRFCAGGFSLIELLIVLAIILVLYTTYCIRYRQNQKQQKKLCATNLRKSAWRCAVYANADADHSPLVPDARTAEEALAGLVPHYAADTAIFICPGSKDSPLPPGEPLTKGQISYAYYMGRDRTKLPEVLLSNRQVNALAKVAGQNAFSPAGQGTGND